jgi:hypothetical protein
VKRSELAQELFYLANFAQSWILELAGFVPFGWRLRVLPHDFVKEGREHDELGGGER